MRFMIAACALTATAMLPLAGEAQTRLPNILSDHAVLQRDRPARVWGWDTPGKAVEVAIHGQHASAITDAAGLWQVYLKPEKPGGPYDLSIAGSTHLVLHDIDFGDVFLASGQSNMGFSFAGIEGQVMPHAQDVLAASTDSELRLLKVPKVYTKTPQEDQAEQWAQSSPQSAQLFSLIGYLFGRAIREQEHVPVGIIETAFGGTPIEAWMSPDALATLPDLAAPLAFWKTQINYAIVPGKPRPLNGAPPPPYDQLHGGSWEASALYNAMIFPLTRYTIKGAIWYQGESSTDPTRAVYYAEMLPTMIQDWRRQWEEPELPFLLVQISSWMGPERLSWGTVRDAERRALTVPNTAMAVTYDIGSEHSQHPMYKQETTDRIVLDARAIIYGEKVEWSGPLFRHAKKDGAAMRISFTHADGLHAKADTLKGFEIAGRDGKFVPATADISGQEVIVSSPSVPEPAYVRYAWANYADGNLYNAANLPAPTFTSQAWSMEVAALAGKK